MLLLLRDGVLTDEFGILLGVNERDGVVTEPRPIDPRELPKVRLPDVDGDVTVVRVLLSRLPKVRLLLRVLSVWPPFPKVRVP